MSFRLVTPPQMKNSATTPTTSNPETAADGRTAPDVCVDMESSLPPPHLQAPICQAKAGRIAPQCLTVLPGLGD